MKRLLFILLCSLLLAPASFAIVDTNNNGLSDLWEKAQNGGNLFSETFDPEADPDLDGWTNAQEAAAGTDPLDPNPPDGLLLPTTAHVPAAEGIPEAVTVIFPTLVGKQYTLFFAFDLAEESWIQFEEPFIGNGSEVTYGFYVNEFDNRFWQVAVTDVDTDGDGLTNHEEHQSGTDPNNPDTDGDGLTDKQEIENDTNPNNAHSDNDGLTDGEDAVPNDSEINWQKTPENPYIWVEQVEDSATHGPPLAVNKHGQILFQALQESTNPDRFAKVLWDTATQEWLTLTTQGSMTAQGTNSPQGVFPSEVNSSATHVVDLNDSGTILGYGAQPSFYDGICCSYPGMVWKTTADPADDKNAYDAPYYFFTSYPIDGFQQLLLYPGGSQLAEDGVVIAETHSSPSSHAVWKSHDTEASDHGMTLVDVFSDPVGSYGSSAILDKQRALLLEGKSSGSATPPKIWLQEGTSRTELSPSAAGPLAISFAPSQDNTQERLWLGANGRVYLEKRAAVGGSSGRWHNPPSMNQRVDFIHPSGVAVTRSLPAQPAPVPPKLWRNGKYHKLDDVVLKPEGVKIIEAIDLTSNGIILAKATENEVEKTGLLLPVELISDLNNDGEITSADNALRDSALKSGASEEDKKKGTEFLFINDKMSNGVWDADDEGVMAYSYGSDYDKMLKPPASHKDDDDAEPLKVSVGGLNTGVVWFDHPTIDKLEFFETRECLPGDKINLTSASPFDLSADTLPETIYVRLRDDWAGTDQEGNLRMFIGKSTTEIWAELQVPLTVVRDFGSKHFFYAARDYILENNSRMCIRDHGYPFGPNPDTIFRLCVMREEATKMTAFDSTAGGEKGIEMSYYAIPAAPRTPAVIINGNQCFWTAGWDEKNPLRWPDMNNEIADKCHGRVISGSVTAATSSDNFDTNTTPAKGSHLAGPDPLGNFPGPDGIVGTADDITNPDALSAGGKYIGCNSGAWTFAAGWAGGSDALGGLSTNYGSSERIDKPHQLVGYAAGMETGKGCIFTATQIKGEGYGPIIKGDASIAGVPALSPSADGGAIKLFILDCGAGSLALMHIDPAGTMRGAYMGRKTTFGFPYYVNNYLALDPAPARP